MIFTLIWGLELSAGECISAVTFISLSKIIKTQSCASNMITNILCINFKTHKINRKKLGSTKSLDRNLVIITQKHKL